MLKLYDYYRSTACYRVRIALNLKQLNYDIIAVNLTKQGGEQHQQSYQHINPQRLVPALDHDGIIITQSLTILDYLEQLAPKPALVPHDPIARSYVNMIAQTIACDIHPLNNLRVLNYLTQPLALDETQKLTWYHHWLQLGLSALEAKINDAKLAGDFCYADTPSIADVCLIPQLYNAHRFEFDISRYPSLSRIEKNCLQLATFKEAYPQEEKV